MLSGSAASVLSCVLFQHLSKSDTLLPVCCSPLWQCFCCVALPVQLHAFPVWYHRWAQLQEQQWDPCEVEGEGEKQIRALWQPQICWLIHIWDTMTWAFVLMKRSREEKATSCHTFGAVGGILTVQFAAGLELLVRRLSRALCAAAIATFCSGCAAKPLPDKLHMLKCFPRGCFSHVCVFFSQTAAEVWGQQCHLFLFQSVQGADVCTIIKKRIYFFAFLTKKCNHNLCQLIS